MAPKKPTTSSTPRQTSSTSSSSTTNTPLAPQSKQPQPSFSSSAASSSSRPSSSSLSSKSSPQDVALHVWNQYLQTTPPRTLLLDVFMAFLVLVGGVQFLYAVVGGNYPFNAFLSGFSAAVGQFVLTASLRMQTTERPPAGAAMAVKKSGNKTVDGVTGEIVEMGKEVGVSSERAFADYVFGSLILHGFCVNFIN